MTDRVVVYVQIFQQQTSSSTSRSYERFVDSLTRNNKLNLITFNIRVSDGNSIIGDYVLVQISYMTVSHSEIWCRHNRSISYNMYLTQSLLYSNPVPPRFFYMLSLLYSLYLESVL